MKELLMIFTHNPDLGKVNSNFVSPEENTEFGRYLKLLNHTYSITRYLDKDKYLFYDSYVPLHGIWEKKLYETFVQLGHDKEEKMLNAFIKGFIKGYDSIVLINSNSLELTSTIINEAFLKLKSHDYVLGPSQEGNFYLIGMKKLNSVLFECKPYQGKLTYEKTIRELKMQNAAFFELPFLKEEKNAEDLISIKSA